MLGRGKTILLTPYFQFERRFDFLFLCVMYTRGELLYLPSQHHGKQCKLSRKIMENYYQISMRYLWEYWDRRSTFLAIACCSLDSILFLLLSVIMFVCKSSNPLPFTQQRECRACKRAKDQRILIYVCSMWPRLFYSAIMYNMSAQYAYSHYIIGNTSLLSLHQKMMQSWRCMPLHLWIHHRCLWIDNFRMAFGRKWRGNV